MEAKDIIEEFKNILENPMRYLKSIDRPIIAYTCSYVPEEIIFGMGFHPLRILGWSKTLEQAQAHLQPYCCSVGMSILQDLLSADLPTAHVVFSNTCDTMQRISDIVRINRPDINHLDLLTPAKLNFKGSENYMIKIINNFYKNLKQSSSKDKILEAVNLFNKTKTLIRDITSISSKKTSLTNQDLYFIQLAGMIMDREDYTNSLQELLEILKNNSISKESSTFKRLIITGSMCQHPYIYEILDQLKTKVVYNDTCTGNRPYERDVPITKHDDIIANIAISLIKRPICPSKHSGIYSRIYHLKNLTKRYEAEGIIYLVPKFCDPHCFDFPDIREHIKIPALFLETGHNKGFYGQEKTRIQAFLERL